MPWSSWITPDPQLVGINPQNAGDTSGPCDLLQTVEPGLEWAQIIEEGMFNSAKDGGFFGVGGYGSSADFYPEYFRTAFPPYIYMPSGSGWLIGFAKYPNELFGPDLLYYAEMSQSTVVWDVQTHLDYRDDFPLNMLPGYDEMLEGTDFAIIPGTEGEYVEYEAEPAVAVEGGTMVANVGGGYTPGTFLAAASDPPTTVPGGVFAHTGTSETPNAEADWYASAFGTMIVELETAATVAGHDIVTQSNSEAQIVSDLSPFVENGVMVTHVIGGGWLLPAAPTTGGFNGPGLNGGAYFSHNFTTELHLHLWIQYPRWRYWKPGTPPLRWVQRDDGLGISGPRQTHRGSLQRSHRVSPAAYR